ncbi:hypothetical protein BDY21DRAFT_208118 [Lineolata rhizophorae]|uniref:Zn(2)-C6 fungal-type domain-containing protein n=1 Tax=Lineolata rhizophorae TaxID=578093 RepID=A0A6A6P3U0_9PEZI|nr:hypothetical protein BDY21DRAFT_208118 [Lineolata rhizophorae]
MPRNQTTPRSSRPRQEPVSCLLCRSKKLKCNRQNPCSNCASRGLPCSRSTPLALVGNSPGESDSSTAAILERLERLESEVSALNGGRTLLSGPQNDRRSPSLMPSTTASTTLSTAHSPFPTEEGVPQVDTHWLQGIATEGDSTVFNLSDKLVFKIQSSQHPYLSSSFIKDGSRQIDLPPLSDAVSIFRIYTEHIDYMQHVIHVPSVRGMIDEIYDRLSQDQPVDTSCVALLLGIFSHVAYFVSLQEEQEETFRAYRELLSSPTTFAKATLDTLDHCRRTGPSTLEVVQATIITGFLMFHIEGFTTRTRNLMTSAITIGRELGFHKLDAPSPGNSNNDPVGTEIRRRCWWHIASTDWLLGFMGGPWDMMYAVQPQHMVVNCPRHVTDEDLIYQGPQFSRPLTEPIIMSYFIQRIRLASVCRRAVDILSPGMINPGQVVYSKFAAVDSDIVKFFNELPSHFRVGPEGPSSSEDALLSPQVITQRYFLNFFAHSLRCKLHLPFLIRGSLHQQYQFSRDMSLDSAHATVRLVNQLDQSGPSIAKLDLRISGVIHQIFMATTVLVMDICLNKDQGLEDQRKADVMGALKILEDAVERSAMAKKFLDSLLATLRKHKVRLQNLGTTSTRSDERPPSAASALQHQKDPLDASNPAFEASNSFDPSLSQVPIEPGANIDEIWQTCMQMEPFVDSQNWDIILSDLDPRCI